MGPFLSSENQTENIQRSKPRALLAYLGVALLGHYVGVVDTASVKNRVELCIESFTDGRGERPRQPCTHRLRKIQSEAAYRAVS